MLEDKTSHDITTEAIFIKKQKVQAVLLTRETGILCGKDIFSRVFTLLDKNIQVNFLYSDGDKITAGEKIAHVTGDVKNIFKGERIALNFLSMLSGISTKVNHAVEILKPFGIGALDTRKTLPGYRVLSKYAVYIGGGNNHRLNLEQMGLIKDNHIAAAGGVKQAIEMFRKKYPSSKCEVEVETNAQLNEALNEYPDMIMLDNMKPDQIKKCMDLIRIFNAEHNANIIVEASGGFNLENIQSLSQTGVDFVSMGTLTNHIKPLDFSLEVLAGNPDR